MINPDAATTISDATRTSLDDLDHLPDNAHVRAVIVLLDVETDDGSTQVLWNTSPPISTAWTHGLPQHRRAPHPPRLHRHQRLTHARQHPRLTLPYPIPDDTVDVPRDIQALATTLDACQRSAPPSSPPSPPPPPTATRSTTDARPATSSGTSAPTTGTRWAFIGGGAIIDVAVNASSRPHRAATRRPAHAPSSCPYPSAASTNSPYASRQLTDRRRPRRLRLVTTAAGGAPHRRHRHRRASAGSTTSPTTPSSPSTTSSPTPMPSPPPAATSASASKPTAPASPTASPPASPSAPIDLIDAPPLPHRNPTARRPARPPASSTTAEHDTASHRLVDRTCEACPTLRRHRRTHPHHRPATPSDVTSACALCNGTGANLRRQPNNDTTLDATE